MYYFLELSFHRADSSVLLFRSTAEQKFAIHLAGHCLEDSGELKDFGQRKGLCIKISNSIPCTAFTDETRLQSMFSSTFMK